MAQRTQTIVIAPGKCFHGYGNLFKNFKTYTMNTQFKYSIRLISTAAHLKEAFSLRYRVYQKYYPLLVAHHKKPCEWDVFDTRSIHLGLYCENKQVKKMVGYCRLIIPPRFSNVLFFLLMCKYPSCLKITEEAAQKLAFIQQLQTVKDNTYIQSLCSSLEAENKLYCEASRLIIDEAHRSILLSSFFITGIFAIGKILDLKYFFISCTQQHAPFYKKFGLELLPCVAEYGTDLVKKPQVVFGTYLDKLNLLNTTVENLKIQMQAYGKISFIKAA